MSDRSPLVRLPPPILRENPRKIIRELQRIGRMRKTKTTLKFAVRYSIVDQAILSSFLFHFYLFFINIWNNMQLAAKEAQEREIELARQERMKLHKDSTSLSLSSLLSICLFFLPFYTLLLCSYSLTIVLEAKEKAIAQLAANANTPTSPPPVPLRTPQKESNAAVSSSSASAVPVTAKVEEKSVASSSSSKSGKESFLSLSLSLPLNLSVSLSTCLFLLFLPSHSYLSHYWIHCLFVYCAAEKCTEAIDPSRCLLCSVYSSKL